MKTGGNIFAELEIILRVNLKFVQLEEFNLAFRQKTLHAEIIHDELILIFHMTLHGNASPGIKADTSRHERNVCRAI